jgi:hypothetical protein
VGELKNLRVTLELFDTSLTLTDSSSCSKAGE